MDRTRRLLATAAVIALLTTGCTSSASAAMWSFGPPATPDSGQPGASTPAGPVATPGASAPVPSAEASMPMPSTAPGGAGSAPVADPNAPAYVERDPKAPAVLQGTVHDIDLPMYEKDMTVAKGFVVKVWTFGDTVPGPVIRVHLGDTVRVHLTNKTNMVHSMDFHSSQTAMDHQMVAIQPGQTFTYTFTADYAGVWMYHCGTAPTLLHIANGMYGMMIVEPKGGMDKVLGPVDNEFAFVQSEWYLGAQGQISDYGKAKATNAAPDFVVFNGIAGQYQDNPIPIKTGGRTRMYVLDAGPNIDSSFHVVGTIFDTVVKEGIVLQKGNADGWGSQAVDLSPAQGAIIEFTPAENGMYAFVNHAFNMATNGALGIFQASGQ